MRDVTLPYAYSMRHVAETDECKKEKWQKEGEEKREEQNLYLEVPQTLR